jgi:DNA-binding MarR family transcriptional regulator
MTEEPGMTDGGYSDLERELVVLVRRARSSAGALAREVHPDLEPTTYALLVRISDAGSVRATDLAAYFGVDKAAVSRQVTSLERLGFLARQRDPQDARAHRLQLTDAGAERLAEVRSARRERVRRQLDSWDPAEVRTFAGLLAKFNATVDLGPG